MFPRGPEILRPRRQVYSELPIQPENFCFIIKFTGLVRSEFFDRRFETKTVWKTFFLRPLRFERDHYPPTGNVPAMPPPYGLEAY